MLRNKLSLAVKVAGLAVVAGLLNPGRALAVLTVTNTGAVAFENDALVAQTPVSASALIDIAGNPSLSVTKEIDPLSGVGPYARGATVYIRIRVGYPQIPDSVAGCGDDSQARNVVISDDLQAASGPGFAYQAGTVEVSETGVAGLAGLGDGASNAVATNNTAGNVVSVTFANPIAECTTAAAVERVIRFRATVQ